MNALAACRLAVAALLVSMPLGARASAQQGGDAQPSTFAIPQSGAWGLEISHAAVEAAIDPAPGARRGAGPPAGFTLKYNFTQGSGFAIARLVLPRAMDLPGNYELSFDLSGKGPPNDLEVKLLDAAWQDAATGTGHLLGESVWWVKRRNVEWPETTTRVNNKAKHFQFAWGPLNGAPIKKLGGIEVVVASSSGGEGSIVVTNVRLRALPPVALYDRRPTVKASGEAPGHEARLAIDEDPKTAWLGDGKEQAVLTVDFGVARDLDALRIDWTGPIRRCLIEVADDPAGPWTGVWTAEPRGAVRSYVDIPDTTARLLRLTVDKQPADDVGIADLRFLARPNVAGAENLGAWPLIAADLPPEAMPRYFTGKQSTWTVLGSPYSVDETLVNEEGDVELFHSGPMLSAVVSLGEPGKPAVAERWSGASQRMDFDGAPMAEVVRTGGACSLTTQAFCTGRETLVRYTLTAQRPIEGTLALCVRPFQVDPPWQFLNVPGGVASVRSIEYSDGVWLINGSRRVTLPLRSTPLTAMGFDQGEAAAMLITDGWAPGSRTSVVDPRNSASAAAACRFKLGAGEQASWLVRVPTIRNSDAPAAAEPSLFDQLRAAERPNWAALDGFSVHFPPGCEQLAASIKASLAYILINKDGPGFQPGSRSYERSWMRDGALTSAALLEFGLTDEVRKFIDWYAEYQFPDGAIPCVVDRRGPDPVVENDSHGEFLYAVAEYYRYTRDEAFLASHFAAVEKAVSHIQGERAKRKTAEYQGGGARAEPGKAAVSLKAFYGLMPESISHEGYSSKPMHSYWDDFFTLKGLRDAAVVARALRKDQQAEAWAAEADDLAACIRASVALAQEAHGVGYVPGCPELGDFDATSTTVALNPCGAGGDLPRAWYDATFNKWWDFFVARMDGKIDWVDYTPYEWRIVGTLVMMGQRERAWAAVQWYLHDQNPPRGGEDRSAGGWLHWAEIVHRDPRAGKWIGDMPHTWVASDFLRSVRTMLVYEEPSPSPELSNLVLFAGVPKEMVEGDGGMSFKGLRTPYGPLNASLKKEGEWYVLHYDGLERVPFRVRLAPPVAWPPKQIEVLEGGGVKNDVTGGIDGVTKGMTVRFR